MSTAILPSGDQIELARGDHRAVIVEVGGGLRTYRVGDWDVLDGYSETDMCSGGRGQPLMPWPNRVRDGRYTYGGESFQLGLSEPSSGTAIHGLVRWANWTVATRSTAHVRMEHVLHAQAGYPYILALAIEYTLEDSGLTVHTEASNRGAHPCPFGAGAHPYLAAGTQTIDSCLLQVPAARRLCTDEHSVPIGSDAVPGTDYDFRAARPIGSTQLDTGYYELARDGDRRARVTLSDPATGRTVTLWQDESYPYVMVFTGDALPEPERRRQGLAVEPMTCAPNAFNSGDGLLTLAPGERFSGLWGIEPARGGADAHRARSTASGVRTVT
jgi:aldose 1-epimerase